MKTWEKIEETLQETVREIFINEEIDSLSDYEKRKTVFEYLVQNIQYDFAKLEYIKDCIKNNIQHNRNVQKELFETIDNKIGICNSISQYYKLLLEQVGIPAYCVICDDGTEVKHQMNVVYDKTNDSYSFDDVASVLYYHTAPEDYFDYDLDYAHSINQGNKFVRKDERFMILGDSYINHLLNREIEPFAEIDVLPTNIISLKSKTSTKHL